MYDSYTKTTKVILNELNGKEKVLEQLPLVPTISTITVHVRFNNFNNKSNHAKKQIIIINKRTLNRYQTQSQSDPSKSSNMPLLLRW